MNLNEDIKLDNQITYNKPHDGYNDSHVYFFHGRQKRERKQLEFKTILAEWTKFCRNFFKFEYKITTGFSNHAI